MRTTRFGFSFVAITAAAALAHAQTPRHAVPPAATAPAATPSSSSAPAPAEAPGDAGATGPVTAPTNAGAPADANRPGALPPNLALPPPPAPVAASPAAPKEAAVEVTVVGTRVSRTAGSAHVIKSKQLERLEYDDPHAVLTTVPGVYTRGEDGVGLRPNIGLRGVNPDRSKKVTLMEDGILFGPAPYSAPAAYYFPLITRMSQVRVIKGPGAISFGPQTVAGAIDMTTRLIPPLTAGGFDAGMGDFGYGKAHGYFGSSDAQGKAGFLVEGIHLRNTGFKELPDGADTGFARNEWMFKSQYLIEPSRHELHFKFTYSDEDSRETYLGLTDADFRAHPLRRYFPSAQDRMRWHRTSVVLGHLIALGENASLKTTLYRHDLQRTWRKVNGFRGADLFDVLDTPADPRNAIYHDLLQGVGESGSPGEALFIGPNQRDFVSQGIDTKLRWQVSTGPVSHRIESGLRLHYDRIDRLHSHNAYSLVRGRLVPEASPTQVTADNEAWTMATAFHLVDAITWKSLTVTPGVRIEILRSAYNDRQTSTEDRRWVDAVLPGIGLYYALTERLGLLAGVHKGFSPPAPGSRGTLSPESSINYEGGARYVQGLFRSEVIGYFNDYSNLTDVCTQSSGCTNANLDRQFDAGEARIYGVEAFAEHEIPVGRLRAPVMLAYTFTKAEFLRDFVSDDPIFGRVRAGDEIPYVPSHQLSVTIGLENSRAGGALVATYVSAMREQAGSEPSPQALFTDEQFVLDATANVRLVGTLALYVNVRNLLNDHYIVSRRPFGARPNAPRWIQAGLKATF